MRNKVQRGRRSNQDGATTVQRMIASIASWIAIITAAALVSYGAQELHDRLMARRIAEQIREPRVIVVDHYPGAEHYSSETNGPDNRVVWEIVYVNGQPYNIPIPFAILDDWESDKRAAGVSVIRIPPD